MKRWSRTQQLLSLALIAFHLGAPLGASADLLELSDIPLFLATKTVPNILFLIDDSQTMDVEVMTKDNAKDNAMTGTQPDGTSPAGTTTKHLDDNDDGVPDCNYGDSSMALGGYIYGVDFPNNIYSGRGGKNCNMADAQEWRFRNSDFNVLYFNPKKTYKPWPGLNEAGQPFTDMPITAAKDDPYQTNSKVIDLTKQNPKGDYSYRKDPTKTVPDGFFYYEWDDKNKNGLFEDGEEIEHMIRNESAAVQQNFANWFSYYRRRSYVMKAVFGDIVAEARNMRLGLRPFNTQSSKMAIDWMTGDPNTLGSNKQKLLAALYSMGRGGESTARQALLDAGADIECDHTEQGKASCPYLSAADGGSCQQSFVLMATDGPYKETFSSPLIKDNDSDGSPVYTINGKQVTYDGGAYADNNKNGDTLADIAMYYYERDLHTGLADEVPTIPGVDEAKHQHVVTFAIAFGVSGTITSDPSDNKKAFSWPDPTNNHEAAKTLYPKRVDDLRHAAYNGRGGFLSANDPDELREAIRRALEAIAIRTSSAASVALNSGSHNANTHVYQARFYSGDWTGQLLSFPVRADGSLGAQDWDAGLVLNSQDYDTGRVILTYNRTTKAGVPFRWDKLSSTQQTYLHTNTSRVNDGQGQARLEFLRGSRAHEGTGNNYRVRSRVLGDLIQSDPYFVGPPNFPDTLGSGYAAFRAAHSGRTPMMVVGSNDGMLHVFHADTGKELLGYVPNEVFHNLSRLTSNPYRHKYFVDGSPTVLDVQLNLGSGSPSWRTLAVSGLRYGGQGYFALDLTDPSQFSETYAGSLALWEFTDADDPDLGYSYSQPSLVRMANGRWAAVFGNGYNNSAYDSHVSSNGDATLFIVFLDGGLDGVWTLGTDYIKITTKAGSVFTPNGLATPLVVDANGDFTAEYIYAGDLRGNLWKFDVSNADPSAWQVAYTDAYGNPAPLYVARDKYGYRQSITSRPEARRHPEGLGGTLVFFGTGRYLEPDDIDNSQPQTIFGIWDQGTPISGRSGLLQQQLVTESTMNGFNVRVTTANTMDWSQYQGWYFDLPASGERQVSDPTLRNGRLILTTLIPNTQICSFGGSGWLMEFDANSGGRLSEPPFDLDGDYKFTASDNVTISSSGSSTSAPPTGVKSTEGILPTPTVLMMGNAEQKFSSGSSGGIFSIRENPGTGFGRLGWRQQW